LANDETLRFDIIGQDHLSDPFTRAGVSVKSLGEKMDKATRLSIALDEAMRRQRAAARSNMEAILGLAAADDSLSEAERKLARDALEADVAIRREAEAKKRDADAARRAAEENGRLASSLQAIAKWKDKGGPAWLGPALLALGPLSSIAGVAAGAAVGIAGAAAAGAAALAAFGAVAKPVLSQALTAEQAVQSAQDTYNVAIANGTKKAVAYKAEQIAIGKAYAEMSPQQIALSKQLGAMGNAWQAVKAAETPVVAGALQPWLRSVTDLTGKLPPVIGAVSPVIRALGTDFDRLVNSAAFTAFRNFVAGTGSQAAGAVGGTLIDWLKSLIILLPKFNPLIEKMTRGIADLGPAFLNWSNSKKASQDITKFMGWFTANGPAVSGLLRNIGGALKALAPGLGPASVTEMNLISGFFGLIAKLPAGIAKPLLDVAGVLLLLNKLGVVGVGIKVLGLGGAAGAAEGAAGEAAAGGAAAGLWGKLLPGVRFAGGALAAAITIDMVLKNTSSGAGKNWLDNPFGQGTYKDPKSGKVKGSPTALTSWITFGHDIEHYWDMTWNNTAGRLTRGLNDMDKLLGGWEHNVAHLFDTLRHDVAHIWDMTWDNTIGRLNNGMNDTDRLLRGWEHNVAHWFDIARHDAAAIWDSVWRNTAGRAASGVNAVMHWIGTLPGRIAALFATAGSWLYGAGRGLVTGLVSGVESLGGSVASAITGLIPAPLRSAWHALGFASGTSSAPPGWAWVGERGPELMHFRGGEQVMPAGASAAAASGRGGDVYYVTVNVPPTVNPREAGRQVADLLGAHIKGGGRLYPAGVTPR
jgi:hypothetical protein